MDFIKKYDKVFDKLTTIFILMFLTVGFLQNCSLTFGTKIISLVQWPTVFLGGLVIVYRLINIKRFVCNKHIWLLVAFIVSFVISMLMNFKYGFYDNFRALIFLVFQICILFAIDAVKSLERLKKDIRFIVNYYIIGVAIMSVASFIVMILGINILTEGGADNPVPAYAIGFYWGRLFGIYWDPNIGAIMAVTAALLSLGFAYIIRSNKKQVVLYLINVFVQVCYVTFSGSRSGRICLVVGITLLTFLYALKSVKTIFKLNRTLSVILVTVIALALSYGAPKVISSVYNGCITIFSSETSDLKVEREDAVVSSDISNRRFDIWNSAYELYTTSPVYGVSHFNIVPYAEANEPDAYIINNGHMQFNTMHNVLVDVLVSQGTLGILVFVSAMLCMAIGIIKGIIKLFKTENYLTGALLFTLIVVSVCSSMFMTELVYVITPITLIFWYALGNAFAVISKIEK